MTVRFVDTNVLLYALSADAEEQDKKHTATELLRARDLCLSSQVLGEFYVQATRQTRPDRLTHDQAAALIRSFSRFPVQAVTLQVAEAAIATCDRFQSSKRVARSARRW
jgi:predicted nucleic acid-binding protein